MVVSQPVIPRGLPLFNLLLVFLPGPVLFAETGQGLVGLLQEHLSAIGLHGGVQDVLNGRSGVSRQLFQGLAGGGSNVNGCRWYTVMITRTPARTQPIFLTSRLGERKTVSFGVGRRRHAGAMFLIALPAQEQYPLP